MKKFISGFLILFLFCNLHVSGGGFQMLSQSHSSAGMAGAVIALQTDGSVIFYNPGGMVFLEKSNVFGGISYTQSRIAFRSNNSGLVDRTESKNMLPFYLGGTIKLSEKMAAGIVVNTPFGYNTTWKSDWEGRYIVLSAKLNTLFIQPTFSYKISEKLGIGAGFVFASANYKWNRALIVADGADAQFDGKATGFGFNAGINYAINKKLTAALTYRSKVKLNFKNTDVAF
ncbi:MAG TPA: outer membrane protein transport protein, partial [Bacteroidia bacterium]|nr:outer membrane protein transport protein [Bacteroidia bacterium]